MVESCADCLIVTHHSGICKACYNPSAAGIAATIHTFWGATLYHPDDVAKVPFAQPKRQPVPQPPPVSASQLQQCCWRLPHVMTDFRKVPSCCKIQGIANCASAPLMRRHHTLLSLATGLQSQPSQPDASATITEECIFTDDLPMLHTQQVQDLSDRGKQANYCRLWSSMRKCAAPFLPPIMYRRCQRCCPSCRQCLTQSEACMRQQGRCSMCMPCKSSVGSSST